MDKHKLKLSTPFDGIHNGRKYKPNSVNIYRQNSPELESNDKNNLILKNESYYIYDINVSNNNDNYIKPSGNDGGFIGPVGISPAFAL